MSIQLSESFEIIGELFEKYKDEPYMIQRMNQYICNRLPKIFDSFKNNYDINQIHEEEMQINQELFIQNFFNDNTYLYHSSTGAFFYYDNTHYKYYSEDDILHHVLSSISKNRQLISWKKSTKIQMMAKIKQNHLLKSIPNSETIQFVLELLMPFFKSKSETKYFLTILGDTVLKKQHGLFHFINSKAKPFLRELDRHSQQTLGIHTTTTFKCKYYDHEYNNCRFINIQENIVIDNLWLPFLNEYFIDIICVAAHYSIRYKNSDCFILSINNEIALNEYTFFLKEKTPNDIVQQFITEYIQILPETNLRPIEIGTITWKNMFYLWKHFLDQHQLPTIIFQQNLKQLLLEKLSGNYDTNSDTFHKVYSMYIPSIQYYLQFWNETITSGNCEDTYEIDELLMLYKKWNPIISNINEMQLLDLITYFYPNTDIAESKYISSIQCSLWDKTIDIRKAIEKYNTVSEKASVYQVYEYYCKIQRGGDNPDLIVSKQYFEKFVHSHLSEYIDIFFIGDS